jgi:hypothetical protein
MPKLLEVLLLKNFCCFILQESCTGFLSNAEKQGLLSLRLLEEKFGNLLKCRVLLLFLLFLFLKQTKEFNISVSIILGRCFMR